MPAGTPINVAMINPAKMPNPPNVGITVLCTLRSSGSSNNFLSFATWIITGIAKKVMMKAKAELSKILSIPNLLFQ